MKLMSDRERNFDLKGSAWINFEPHNEGKVKCKLCGKIIGHQRIARGAHAAWHKRQGGKNVDGNI